MKIMKETKIKCEYIPISVLVCLITVSFFMSACSDKKISIGFIIRNNIENQEEITAAYSFLTDHTYYDSKKISFKEIAQNNTILADFDLIWYHDPDISDFPETDTGKKVITAVKKYIDNQGNLLLTQNAFNLLPILGLEKHQPQSVSVEVKDQGYGRKRGFHAFRSHPIFNSMHGGSYIFNPPGDTIITQTGYFKHGERIQGKTAAVDWAYIRLKENKRLVLEYPHKEGTVMAIGAYMQFSLPNNHRIHFEQFFRNVIDYVTAKNKQKAYFWHYGDKTVQSFTPDTEFIKFPDPRVWDKKLSEIGLKREEATDNYWDLAGQRLVIMGKENCGIEEIWTHPVMTLRDYEIGYRFESDDTVHWLNKQHPKITIEPHAVTRSYTLGDAKLRETITAHISEPVGVIHYEYRGEEPTRLYVRFKSNLRYMWPYSSRVFGSLNYAWDKRKNYYIIKDASGDFSAAVGFNKKPDKLLIGQYDSVYCNHDKMVGISGSTFQVNTLSEFFLTEHDIFDVVISSSGQGIRKCEEYYYSSINDPYLVYTTSLKYYEDLLKEKLRITTPDEDFNQGYKWALVGTDKFFVHTPGIGKSLVAGYATTAKGWDGGHKVNGRPGYAWYFGRDAQWSGFAVNDYGDFAKVKETLIQFLNFQDISGKIYHELTTSGVVHYDAADATPLFVVLAGEYLHHSGDKDFIQQNWTGIKKALDYCYSTDTDNDNLIENKNVGHGWVEGGHLFGGKSTLYLSSCWAAALEQAWYMADVLGKNAESERYKNDHDAIVEIINQKFWNGKTRFFNHSINENGSFITDVSVMPTIPLYFNQIQDYSKTQSVLDRLASNMFTANWGVRIVSEESEHFYPRGYHTGSVWPLFTGWTALAEYENYKPLQGFQHLMDNLVVYKDWSLGYIEEVLHGAVYQPSGVCSHQCWSETMVLQPLIEGMLGLHPSACDNYLLFNPSIPFEWSNFLVENIRIGDSFLSMYMEKKDKMVNYTFNFQGRKKLNINFQPLFPIASHIKNIYVNGEKIEYKLNTKSSLVIPEIHFTILDQSHIEIEYEGGIFIIPDNNQPVPAESAEGLRIISDKFRNDIYTINLEAPSGSGYDLNVFSKNLQPKRVRNAVIIEKSNNFYTLRVDFGKKSTKYVKKEIVVEF